MTASFHTRIIPIHSKTHMKERMPLDFPDFYLLSIGFHNNPTELLDLQTEIGKSLVHNNAETNLFVGRVTKSRRAIVELIEKVGIWSEPVEEAEVVEIVDGGEERASKRRRMGDVGRENEEPEDREEWKGKEPECIVIDDDDTASEDGGASVEGIKAKPAIPPASLGDAVVAKSMPIEEDLKGVGGIVKVLNLTWYFDSIKAGKVLSIDKYIVYTGRRISKPSSSKALSLPKSKPTILPAAILARARADSPPPPSFTQSNFSHGHKRGPSGSQPHSQRSQQPAFLRTETTTEHDAALDLPPLPEYLQTRYSCQRPTPAPTPNDAFIAQLKKILQMRRLQCDKVGALAYNAAISSIAAYPYTITTVEEILRLPRCGEKYAGLFQEWRDTGRIAEVEDYEVSEKFQALNIFYGIYDVEGITANTFYSKGWRNLDDVIEYGWDSLQRNQQIGVKVYDDLQLKIPRGEVQRIGDVVLRYANQIHEGFRMVICGGYRRGKAMCGDVDVILTHPDSEATDHVITPLVHALVEDEWIPYTLGVSTSTSNRGQEPLEWKGGGTRGSRSGFDSLDKALVVWQDPEWEGMDAELAVDVNAKNPNVHRRVDIIITPWKTAGCAVVGWSGGTMFERDLRSYSRAVKGWKFDSSGVRRLSDGEWVDLEGDATDLLVKEKRVFEGLGLEWREPGMRCTDG